MDSPKRSTTRRTAACTEPPPATKVKSPKTKTTSRTTSKRTRKAAADQPEFASSEVGPTSHVEARVRSFMTRYNFLSLIYSLQDRHRQMVYAKYRPLVVLPNEYLPHLEEGARAPRLLFGWAFNQEWMLELARRRRLTFDVQRSFRRHFGGCGTFNFADVAEDHLHLPSLRQYLGVVAFRCVRIYIQHKTHAHFTVEPPVSDKWNSMFVLWTNYDIKDSYRGFQATATWSQVKDFMDELMNEGLPSDSDRSQSLWWWSHDNNLVSFETFALSIDGLLTGLTDSACEPNRRVTCTLVLQHATHIPHVSIRRDYLGLLFSHLLAERRLRDRHTPSDECKCAWYI